MCISTLFLFMTRLYSIIQIYHIDGHLAFHLLAIMSSSVMLICVHVLCRHVFRFSWVYTLEWSAGSHVNSMLNHLRNCQNRLTNVCPGLHSYHHLILSGCLVITTIGSAKWDIITLWFCHL